jgi:hypothetical protein
MKKNKDLEKYKANLHNPVSILNKDVQFPKSMS